MSVSTSLCSRAISTSSAQGEGAALPLGPLPLLGEVGDPQDHVLAGHGDGPSRRRRQDVVRRQHEEAGLQLRFERQGHVDGHLVPVEVRVEGGADEGMELDGLALDKHGLERLDAQAVEGRRAVQEDRVVLDHLVQHVPHLGLACSTISLAARMVSTFPRFMSP